MAVLVDSVVAGRAAIAALQAREAEALDAALGGATCEANLAHLCRRHHTLKHATRWTVRQLAGGVLERTSPTSRQYTDTPEPVVRFMPSGDPPPF